jgi:hypothetical protein
MMRDKRGPLVPGERTGTKGGHARVKNIFENPREALTHAHVASHMSRDFSREIYACADSNS